MAANLWSGVQAVTTRWTTTGNLTVWGGRCPATETRGVLVYPGPVTPEMAAELKERWHFPWRFADPNPFPRFRLFSWLRG